MNFLRIFSLLIIIIFSYSFANAKPLPPGVGQSAPANILIMLDRTYSMLDPIDGKTTNDCQKGCSKVGWMSEVLDVAPSHKPGVYFVSLPKNDGLHQWDAENNKWNKTKDIWYGRPNYNQKNAKFSNQRTISLEYHNGIVYGLSEQYKVEKDGLKNYLGLYSVETKDVLKHSHYKIGNWLTQETMKNNGLGSLPGTDDCNLRDPGFWKGKKGAADAECFSYDVHYNDRAQHFGGISILNGKLYFTTELVQLVFTLNSSDINTASIKSCDTKINPEYVNYARDAEGIEAVEENGKVYIYLKKFNSNKIAKFSTETNGCISSKPIVEYNDTKCGTGRGDSIAIKNGFLYSTGNTSSYVCKYEITSTKLLLKEYIGGTKDSEKVNTTTNSRENIYFSDPRGIYVDDKVYVANSGRLEVTMLDKDDLSYLKEFGNKGTSRLQGAKDAIISVVSDGTLTQEAHFGISLWAKETEADFTGFDTSAGFTDYIKPLKCHIDGCLNVGIHPGGAAEIKKLMQLGFELRLKTHAMSFARLADRYFTNPDVAALLEESNCEISAIIVIGDGEWEGGNKHTNAMKLIKKLYDTKDIKTYAVPYGMPPKKDPTNLHNHDKNKERGLFQFHDLAQNGGTDYERAANTPEELKDVLRNLVQDIIQKEVSYTSPSISAELKDSGELFQSKFQYRSRKEWWGTVRKISMTEDGYIQTETDPNDSSKTRPKTDWDAALKMPEPNQRKIWTVIPGDDYTTDYNNFTIAKSNTIRNELFQMKGHTLGDYYKDNTCNKAGINGTIGDEDKGLIKFIRGEDYFNYNNDCNNLTKHRTRTDDTGAVYKSYMADIYNSQILVVGKPKANISPLSTNTEANWRLINNYDTFAKNNSSRKRIVYAAANNGILHAIDAKTGVELWGFVPPLVAGKIPKIINPGFNQKGKEGGTNPEFILDGSPIVHDTYFDKHPILGSNGWYTLLMIPYGRGGAGFSTLDITNPDDPLHLYSILNDPSSKTIYHVDHKGNQIHKYGYKTARYDISNFEEVAAAAVNYSNGTSDVCKNDKSTSCYKGKKWTLTTMIDPSDGNISIEVDGYPAKHTLSNSNGQTEITFDSLEPRYKHNRQNSDDPNSVIEILQMGNLDTAGYHYDYRFLGETWGAPRVFRMPPKAGDKSIYNDEYVAVMPGGYDVGAGDVGSNLYIINWKNGKVIKRIEIADKPNNGIYNSVPATPVVITSENSGGHYRGALVYVNDLEGKITKINLTNLEYEHAYDPNSDALSAKTGRINLYDQTTLLDVKASRRLNNRLMFHPMDAGIGLKSKKLFLFGGTGDFMNINDSKIQNKNTQVNNVMFGIKDSHFPYFGHVNDYTSADDLLKCKNTTGTLDDSKCPTSADLGWYVELDERQKVTAEPTLAGNTVYFPTYKPSKDTTKKCGEGDASICAVDADCGTNLSDKLIKAQSHSDAIAHSTNNQATLQNNKTNNCYHVGTGVLSKIVAFGGKLYANVSGKSEVYSEKDDLVIIDSIAEDITNFRSSWRENF